MTGDRELIRQYLDELRLSLRIPEVGRILVEAEDHLREAAAAGTAAGLTETEAQQAAITGFGPVRVIVYAHLTRHGRARRQGLADPSFGHRYGAYHVENVLNWCEKTGITHVTVFVCSAENLASRGDAELAFLMQVIEQVIADKLSREPTWQVHIAGALDMLPDTTAQALKRAVEASRDCATGAHVTLAVGYGGRQEVIEAFRSLLYEHAERGTTLAELAETITTGDIARHLYTAGQPDPDLVIRTSGEQRLSNFLLWQSAYSELYFCEAYWPAFREIDFLRALRSFAARQRRYGR
jgi:short-chain Z-isoprenyl diphosphate synthase